jgi:hypothetical protein
MRYNMAVPNSSYITGVTSGSVLNMFSTWGVGNYEYEYRIDTKYISIPEQPPRVVICEYCGTKVLDKDRSCVACGAPVGRGLNV